MTPLAWIIISGLLMSLISLVGGFTLLLTESSLEKLLLPLVAFAAGSLLSGAFVYMLPAAAKADIGALTIGILTLVGLTTFFVLEQFLHWQHSHRSPHKRKEPMTYLILIGDGLHNFLGGIAIGGIFMVDVRLGIASWIAAALHEIPQELGDFAVLTHGGWSKRSALTFNLLSGLTFLLGGLTAYVLSSHINIAWLIPFAAGNFIYIGACDLIPKVNQQTLRSIKDRIYRFSRIYGRCFFACFGCAELNAASVNHSFMWIPTIYKNLNCFSIDDSTVTLTGSVATAAQRYQAFWAAWSAPGVRSVVNNIIIAPNNVG